MNCSFDLGAAPVFIPLEEVCVLQRNLIGFRSYFALTLRIMTIPYAKQAAMFGPGLVEHSIVIWVWRTICHTVLKDVEVYATPPFVDKLLLRRTLFYLF